MDEKGIWVLVYSKAIKALVAELGKTRDQVQSLVDQVQVQFSRDSSDY
jgi:intracellular sulfur oxidation DsrE/DsrF family protein